MWYLYDLFFIFILITHIISLKQTHLFFGIFCRICCFWMITKTFSSPWDSDHIGIKLEAKVIPKVSKFHVEKGYLCYQACEGL